jgi:release factor glutamine methyltransferase
MRSPPLTVSMPVSKATSWAGQAASAPSVDDARAAERMVAPGTGRRRERAIGHTDTVMSFRLQDTTIIRRLMAAGCVAAAEEAGELVSAAPDDDTLDAWIHRREAGEPLAWITGRLGFCGHTVLIDPGVYVPRVQSEELASRAAALLAASGGRAADLCTGAGAVAVTLMADAPGNAVVGVDIDPRAVGCARRNGVAAVLGDLGDPLRSDSFDVVAAVAPYVPTGEVRLLPADVQRYEPRLALDGGADGLDLVRRIVVAAARLLRPGGWLLTELGGDQDRRLRPALAAAGFVSVTTWSDQHGELRGVAARAAPDRGP